jgi:UDP-glucose 4-epimerase
MKKKPILKIYGTDYNTPDGTCIRDFIHVSDIAEIHEKVLNKMNNLNKSVILNCGYNQGISVLQVAKEFKNQSKKKMEIIKVRKRPGDLGKIIASNTKLNNFIKWKPKFKSLSYMVKSSILWEQKLLK